MVTKEFAEASAEISEILSYLPNEYIQKIPKNKSVKTTITIITLKVKASTAEE